MTVRENASDAVVPRYGPEALGLVERMAPTAKVRVETTPLTRTLPQTAGADESYDSVVLFVVQS